MLVQTPSAWSVKPSNESRLTWRAGQNSVFLACRQPRPDVKAAERSAVSGILPGLASGCPTPCRQSLRSVVEPARDFPEFLRFILLPGASVSRLPRVRICHSNTKPRRGLICRNDTISLPVFDLHNAKSPSVRNGTGDAIFGSPGLPTLQLRKKREVTRLALSSRVGLRLLGIWLRGKREPVHSVIVSTKNKHNGNRYMMKAPG